MVGGEDVKNVAAVEKMTIDLKASGNKKVFNHVDWINWMFKFSTKK